MIDDRLEWALSLCARVMRPLVRLALNMGVRHRELEQLVRDLLVEEARRSWMEKGVEPNISQLSITTGRNRTAVTVKVRGTADGLPHTDMSAASKTLTAWLELIATLPDLKTLPVSAPESLRAIAALRVSRKRLGNSLLTGAETAGNHRHFRDLVPRNGPASVTTFM